VVAGYQVVAVNPLAASRYRERHTISRAKSDRRDARMLADLVRTERANGVATDLRYATPLSPTVDVRAGDYDALVDAALVITAGVNEKAGGATDRSDPQGRLRLLETNAKVYTEIVPKIVAAAPRAVLMVVTDPPDPLVDSPAGWPTMTGCSQPAL
jgi:malate/lactate dehydrogenase